MTSRRSFVLVTLWFHDFVQEFEQVSYTIRIASVRHQTDSQASLYPFQKQNSLQTLHTVINFLQLCRLPPVTPCTTNFGFVFIFLYVKMAFRPISG